MSVVMRRSRYPCGKQSMKQSLWQDDKQRNVYDVGFIVQWTHLRGWREQNQHRVSLKAAKELCTSFKVFQLDLGKGSHLFLHHKFSSSPAEPGHSCFSKSDFPPSVWRIKEQDLFQATVSQERTRKKKKTTEGRSFMLKKKKRYYLLLGWSWWLLQETPSASSSLLPHNQGERDICADLAGEKSLSKPKVSQG